MIASKERQRIAGAIERYLNGEVNSFELDDALSFATKDVACYEVSLELSELCDDFEAHWYRDYPLSPEHEKGVRRWVRFLSTDAEWPRDSRYSANFFVRIAQVFYSTLVRNESEFTNNVFWPFNDEEDWTRFCIEYPALRTTAEENKQRPSLTQLDEHTAQSASDLTGHNATIVQIAAKIRAATITLTATRLGNKRAKEISPSPSPTDIKTQDTIIRGS